MRPGEAYQAAAYDAKLNDHTHKYADVVIPPYVNMSGNAE
jgi:hypothetical protein